MGRKKKEWLTTIDGRERPDHAAANGQVVLSQDAFTVGGEKLRFPGDPQGSPGNTINCRCTVLPVVGEAALPEEAPAAAMPDVWQDPMAHRRQKDEWREWGQQEWADWEQGLTEEEQLRMIQYCGHHFDNINRYLRGWDLASNMPFASEREVKQALAALDSAIEKGVLKEDMILWRGFSMPGVKAEDLVGQVIQDDAFSSTSISEDVAHGYAWSDRRHGRNAMMAEIRAPAGTHAAYIENVASEASLQDIGQYVGDFEMLLKRGTRFRVVDLKYYPSEFGTPRADLPYLVLEILP